MKIFIFDLAKFNLIFKYIFRIVGKINLKLTYYLYKQMYILIVDAKRIMTH